MYKRQSFFWPESTIEQVKMWKECFLRIHLFQRDYYCDVVLREKKHTHTPSNNNNKIKENELLGWRKCITVAYRPTNHPVCTIRLRSDHKAMCNECSRYSGETHSMGIMLLRSYHNSVSASYLHIEMWCRIFSIIIYFHPFFVRLSFFFCFSVFLCVRWDVYRTIFVVAVNQSVWETCTV